MMLATISRHAAMNLAMTGRLAGTTIGRLAGVAAFVALLAGCAGRNAPPEASAPPVLNEPARRAEYLSEVAAGGPGAADAAYALAGSYWRSHKADSSRIFLEQTLTLDPHHGPALAWLSRLLYEEGEIERGITLLEPAIAAEGPVHPEVLTNMALLKLAWGESETAATLLARAIAEHPGYAPAHGNLGYFHLQNGDMERAASELTRAIALDSKVPEYHNNLGIVHRKQQKFAEAGRDFDRALDLDPDFREAHHNLALLYKLYLADPERARNHFRQFIALGGQADAEVQALFRVGEETN
jgi:Flp pilus assembly protein TadD